MRDRDAADPQQTQNSESPLSHRVTARGCIVDVDVDVDVDVGVDADVDADVDAALADKNLSNPTKQHSRPLEVSPSPRSVFVYMSVSTQSAQGCIRKAPTTMRNYAADAPAHLPGYGYL